MTSPAILIWTGMLSFFLLAAVLQAAPPALPDSLAPPFDVFDQWLKETGERPPDWSKMKAVPDLPPLLELADGRPVKTPADWAARRAELRELLSQWIYGHAPDVPPPAFKAEILSEQKTASAIDREVRLTFECPRPVSFVVHVLLPRGKGPFPVFLTQWTHKEWAAMGVARGYLACYYPGADGHDETGQFAAAYPQANWALLRKRAWMCSRVLDYLLTLPEADNAHVALTGHSRNGKQSLVAAAFDERITAVIASSAGAGGSAPWRYTSEYIFNESVELMSRSTPARLWFTPRIRFFTGREQFLPIDDHALLGLIAPRACLLSVSHNDGPGTTFGDEMQYLAGRDVYRWLKCPEKLRILYRPGNHETMAKDIENYFDWYDTAFGRLQREWPERLYHEFDWPAWRARQNEAALVPPAKEADARTRVLWGLGVPPPAVRGKGSPYGALPIAKRAMVNRADPDESDGVVRTGFAFGEYVAGDLYYKKDAKGPLPVAVWLHHYAYNYGYNAESGLRFVRALAAQGWLVVAFDQAGMGTRYEEKPLFYTRYPQWSLLGKMVRDVQASLDCLLEGRRDEGGGLTHAWLKIPPLDPARVVCVGYSLGGTVGLYATALDPRISGMVSLCGFTPLRTDTAAKPTGGLKRFSRIFALQPRLGLYEGKEAELPYDFDDVLKLIAPRRCVLIAPLGDRQADAAEVKQCVESVRGAWEKAGKADALHLEQPVDYNRFREPQERALLEWLRKM